MRSIPQFTYKWVMIGLYDERVRMYPNTHPQTYNTPAHTSIMNLKRHARRTWRCAVERDGGRRVMPRSSVAIPENVSTIAPIRPDAMLPARIIWWGMTERFSTFIYTRLASVVTWKNLQCITNLYICQAGRNSDMGAWKV